MQLVIFRSDVFARQIFDIVHSIASHLCFIITDTYLAQRFYRTADDSIFIEMYTIGCLLSYDIPKTAEHAIEGLVLFQCKCYSVLVHSFMSMLQLGRCILGAESLLILVLIAASESFISFVWNYCELVDDFIILCIFWVIDALTLEC